MINCDGLGIRPNQLFVQEWVVMFPKCCSKILVFLGERSVAATQEVTKKNKTGHERKVFFGKHKGPSDLKNYHDSHSSRS